MLDQSDKAVEGYSRAECVPISTNSTDCTVKWGDDRDLVHATDTPADIGVETRAYKSRLRKPVRLRFYLKDASLCSFLGGVSG